MPVMALRAYASRIRRASPLARMARPRTAAGSSSDEAA